MSTSALLTDLYQLTMVQAYLEEDLLDEAVFSLFVRRLPEGRNYLLACGLDDVLRYLEELQFDSESLDYLESLDLFSKNFLRALESFASKATSTPSPKARRSSPTSRSSKSSRRCRRRRSSKPSR